MCCPKNQPDQEWNPIQDRYLRALEEENARLVEQNRREQVGGIKTLVFVFNDWFIFIIAIGNTQCGNPTP